MELGSVTLIKDTGERYFCSSKTFASGPTDNLYSMAHFHPDGGDNSTFVNGYT